jgi:hypothetical protein
VIEGKALSAVRQVAGEEQELFAKERGGSASDAECRRLRRLQDELDGCWDLLRQRRARREAGLDPDGAQTRDGRAVEGYTG